MKKLSLTLSAALLAACAQAPSDSSKTQAPVAPAASTAPAALDVPLIPRRALFGNPERSGGTISPDGKTLAYLAPRDGVMNVYVADRMTPNNARPLTQEKSRPVRGFFIAEDNAHVLYVQDTGGNENFHVIATNIATGATRNLTPFEGARANIAGVSDKVPGSVLISINNRDKAFFDLHQLDIASGKLTLLEKNDQGFAGYLTDDAFRVRMAIKPLPDGGSEVLEKTTAGWKSYTTIPFEDAGTTGPSGLTSDGKTLYFRDSRDRDTSALYAIDLASGTRTLVHEDARADVGGTLNDIETGKVQAVAVNYLRNEWTVLDPRVEKDIALLKSKFPEFGITSRTNDDKTWVVAGFASDRSASFYLYERDSGSITPWFDTRPQLADAPLQRMHTAEIKARDGLILPSYYTLPAHADPDKDGKANFPVPMMLFVHGGPWARDGYGNNSAHQFYANRGYAVLSVNFRASTGFGKNFTNAGNMQWGKSMHDDLIDAVRWAEQQGIAAPGKVAIGGGSYGGYATLAGLTFTPEEFACGVDIVGPSNLNTLLATIPPYWKSIFEQMVRRMGDPRTPEGQKILSEASPVNHAEKIRRPLLIGQGANDPRVKQAESDQIINAMKKLSLPVTYVLFPDEGHGFARPENSLAFNAVQEQFLAKCLGGRAEPIGDAFKGSSITIPEGLDLIDGAASALAAAKP
jgi:dipeptidyl aminopeptidase/acylaminoacyl peptidase